MLTRDCSDTLLSWVLTRDCCASIMYEITCDMCTDKTNVLWASIPTRLVYSGIEFRIVDINIYSAAVFEFLLSAVRGAVPPADRTPRTRIIVLPGEPTVRGCA